MYDVVIDKVNESYIKITTNYGILTEISDYFRFLAPNHKFMPKYKSGAWDGYIRLLDMRTGYLPYGLLGELLNVIDILKYTVDVKPEVNTEPNKYTYDDILNFSKKLNLHSDGNPITLAEHQINAIQQFVNWRGITLLSPTSSGKSAIIYTYVRWLLDHDNHKKILIIVPTIQLVRQMYLDFCDYSCDTEYIDSLTHQIIQGKEKNADRKVYISTWQSLQNLPDDYFNQFDAVIGDEAHGAQAPVMNKIILNCKNARKRHGTTGTLNDATVHKLQITGLFGPIINFVTTNELVEKGFISSFDIKCIVLKHPKEICQQIKKAELDYEQEREWLITNKSRNKFIVNLAGNLKNNTLILFSLVEKHGVVLTQMLAEKYPDKQIFLLTKDSTLEERDNVRRIAEQNDNVIIIASYKLFSTGVNIKNLHNIIFASPSKARITILQSIGRTIRKHASKAKAYIYDISDDLRPTPKAAQNITLKHFAERLKIYEKEEFNVKMYKIDLI